MSARSKKSNRLSILDQFANERDRLLEELEAGDFDDGLSEPESTSAADEIAPLLGSKGAATVVPSSAASAVSGSTGGDANLELRKVRKLLTTPTIPQPTCQLSTGFIGWRKCYCSAGETALL